MQEGSRFCKYCGATVQVAGTPAPPPPVYPTPTPTYQEPLKNEGIAALASALLPGAGQIYVGREQRGIVVLIATAVIAMVSVFLFFVPYIIFWAWNIFDAHKLAKQYNEAIRTTGRPPPNW